MPARFIEEDFVDDPAAEPAAEIDDVPRFQKLTRDRAFLGVVLASRVHDLGQAQGFNDARVELG